MRNRIQLEALDRIDAALFDGSIDYDDDDDDDDLPPVAGDGSAAQPWIVDVLPFIHDGDTAMGEVRIDTSGCDDADQSGPERTYVLELSEPRALRIIALDREGVDVDVHVLADSEAESCVARGDHMVAGTLGAGVWQIVLDSWSDGAIDSPGRYLLAVVPCDADDPQCA